MDSASRVLLSQEGELVLVRVTVEPRSLEELLEALATLSFPVNPEIYHAMPATRVEFPAYESKLAEVRRVLETCGFARGAVETLGMLKAIA